MHRCSMLSVGTLAIASVMYTQSPSETKDAMASIEGSVTEKTGGPIEGASVTASGPKRAHTVTDTKGRFIFKGLPPGSYVVSGWVTPPIHVWKRIAVADGQALTGVTLPLERSATISGQVMDPDGKPVARADVFLVGRAYEFGTLRYSYRHVTSSDDRGIYTLDRLFPGVPYLVMARRPARSLPSLSPVAMDPEARPPAFAPTYYPSSPLPEGAEVIKLTSGERRDNLNVKMIRTSNRCIEGFLSQADGQPSKLAFEITDRTPAAGFYAGGGVYADVPRGESGTDGRFRICDLYAGGFRLVAKSLLSADYYGTVDIDIGDRDLRNITVPAAARISLPGTVTMFDAEGTVAKTSNISVSLEPLYRSRYSGEALSAASRENAFVFPNLILGEYIVQVGNMPEKAYVKDILYGNSSVLFSPLKVGTEPLNTPLRVIVGTDGAAIRATVRDKEGRGIPDVPIALFPQAASTHGEVAAQLTVGQTDSSGVFTSTMLGPAKYRILALRRATTPSSSEEDIRWLLANRSKGQEIAVEKGIEAQVMLERLDE